MERFKDQFVFGILASALFFVAACADRDNNSSSQKSFPTSKYVCDNRAQDTKVTLLMEGHSDPKYLGDLVTRATLESEGLKVEIGLMLAMNFRDNRGVLEIKRALALRNLDGPEANKNIVVVNNADQAPDIMALDVEGGELEIISRPLKRLILFGLTRRNESGVVPEVNARPEALAQPLFLDCKKK